MADMRTTALTGPQTDEPELTDQDRADIQMLMGVGDFSEQEATDLVLQSKAATTEEDLPQQLGRFHPERNTTGFGEIDAPYTEDDVSRIMFDMSTEERVRLQERMETAGFQVGQIGSPDPSTQRGFGDLLTLSNQQGMHWSLMLSQMVKSSADAQELMEERGEGEDGEELPRQPVTLIPDMDRLKMDVRARFRDALDRDPTQAELQLFSNKMMEDYQQAAQANNAPGPEFDPDDEGMAGKVTVREKQDPRAAFERKFQEKFGGTIERLEDRQETAAVRQQVQQGIEGGP